ncbi:MAG: high-affinity branched-chain amino acid ABC transporter permease LivM [Magnetococcus sp. YQC-5]
MMVPSEEIRSRGVVWTPLLRDALIAGLIGWLLFAPLTGVALAGYDWVMHWERPLWLAGIVAAGRLLMGWVMARRRLSGIHEGRGAWSGLGREPSFIFTMISGWRALAKSGAWREKYSKLIYIIVTITALLPPLFLGKYWLNVAILALIYVLLSLGLNIVVGLAGLLDLGFVAFYAVGAYGYGLGSHYLGLSFWSALPFAAVLAAGCGVVLGFPVLRMHGDYLAIVTLGFGEIVRLLLNNWVSLTGGPNGIRVPFPSVLGVEFSRRASPGYVTFHEYFSIPYDSVYRDKFMYLLLLIVVCGMVFFVRRLRRMPLGRAWEALREDEIACRALGINPVTVKLSAFGLGAMTGGVGGVFFAASQGFVNPTSFTFMESAHILAIVVLGGMGSTSGVIVAAVILTVLPETLRDFAEYRGLLIGLAMVLMMIWRPGGLLRARRAVFQKPG